MDKIDFQLKGYNCPPKSPNPILFHASSLSLVNYGGGGAAAAVVARSWTRGGGRDSRWCSHGRGARVVVVGWWWWLSDCGRERKRDGGGCSRGRKRRGGGVVNGGGSRGRRKKSQGGDGSSRGRRFSDLGLIHKIWPSDSDMESLLMDFELQHKNPSVEALRRQLRRTRILKGLDSS